jgi:hypothetical protein
MKNILVLAAAIAVLSGGHQAIAQTSTHKEKVVKHEGPGLDTKTKTETVVGVVKRYEPGKEIEILGPKDKTHSFDLDENAQVHGAILVGQKATVRFTKAADGTERVLVLSNSQGAAPSAAAAPKVHMESTMTHEGPGPDAKTRTKVVIGTVKEYLAGEKIKVIGPKEKKYTFDLDENVAVKGVITPGQRVKVEYTKHDGTEHVVIISPWNEASPR